MLSDVKPYITVTNPVWRSDGQNSKKLFQKMSIYCGKKTLRKAAAVSERISDQPVRGHWTPVGLNRFVKDNLS